MNLTHIETLAGGRDVLVAIQRAADVCRLARNVRQHETDVGGLPLAFEAHLAFSARGVFLSDSAAAVASEALRGAKAAYTLFARSLDWGQRIPEFEELYQQF